MNPHVHSCLFIIQASAERLNFVTAHQTVEGTLQNKREKPKQTDQRRWRSKLTVQSGRKYKTKTTSVRRELRGDAITMAREAVTFSERRNNERREHQEDKLPESP